MKKCLIKSIILALLFLNSYAQEWSIVSEPDIRESLNDIFFLDAYSGWAVGDGGLILYTTDGGVTWNEQNSNTERGLTSVFFYDNENGWAGTLQSNLSKPLAGAIVRTTDAGQTWTEIDFSYLVPNTNFTACDGIFFTSPLVGHMLAGKSKQHYIFKTTDGGLTWEIKDSLIATTNMRWYDVNFLNANKGVVVGNRKEIQKYTTNGGETWIASEPINDNFFRDLRAVRWLSESIVLAMGEGNEFFGVPTPVYKSFDGGKTWEKKTQFPTNSYDRIKDAYFKNPDEGIAMGSNGFSYAFIYKTSDGGETWTASSADYAFGIKAVAGKGDTVYALGTSGHFIKSTDFGETWNIIPLKPPASIYGLQLIEGRGYAVTRNSDVLVNTDGSGAKWEYTASSGLWNAESMWFLSKDIGFIQKENRHIVKTTDGGLTWDTALEPVVFSSRNKVGGITFADQNTGYAWMSILEYEEYYVYKTTDGGDSWERIWLTAGPSSLSGDIGFFDANNGFLAGPNVWLQLTTDGGASWNEAVINDFPEKFAGNDFEDISVIDENTAFAIGEKFMLKTTDKGNSWKYVDHGITGIDSSFFTVAFHDNNAGYIGCYNGVILETTDGGSSWSKDETFKDQFSFFSSAFNEQGKILFGTSNGHIIGWDVTVDVKEEKVDRIPSGYVLEQNYPNPFNPSTTINYSIPTSSHPQTGSPTYQGEGVSVSLKVYDILGKEVATLVNESKSPGAYRVEFDASSLSSGVYYYQMVTELFRETRKMLLVK